MQHGSKHKEAPFCKKQLNAALDIVALALVAGNWAGRKGVRTTAMIVPNTQDLIHEVTMSQDVMARQAESRMTLAETPYTVSAKPTLAASPA